MVTFRVRMTFDVMNVNWLADDDSIVYHVPCSHQGMFPRTDLPRYKVRVFGYLVDNIYRPRTYGYITHRLLTGYHISHAIITAKVLTRYYDEDNDYTRRYHIFRPIFLWNELRASFA